jgi:putative transcriptional regulator
MAIVVNLAVVLAQRRIRSKELAERIGLTEANVSLLKSGKVRGIRFETLSRICAVLDCQPGDLLSYVEGDDPRGPAATNVVLNGPMIGDEPGG